MYDPKPKKKKYPKKVGSMVGSLLKKWQGQAEKQEIIFSAVWQKIVGERMAKHTRLDQIRRKKLIVVAESSAWMNELTFLKEKIKLEAKNSLVEYGINIDEVVFKLGSS
jgi:predicted nucleic acid-binding Zn ribbon protein